MEGSEGPLRRKKGGKENGIIYALKEKMDFKGWRGGGMIAMHNIYS